MNSSEIVPILPGATIGILGGGQLGRMLAVVAKRMGYAVCVYSDVKGFLPKGESPPRIESSLAIECPAAQVADHLFCGDYTDEALLKSFCEVCDVITYEFENIPASTCHFLLEHVPVRPHPRAIFVAQNRARERELLERASVPVAPFHVLETEEDLITVPESFIFPAIVKTAELGYDGKGQAQASNLKELQEKWCQLGKVPCIVEEKLSFEKEFSIVIARSASGDSCCYGPIVNEHVNHILDCSTCPGDLPSQSIQQGKKYAENIANALEIEGVITIEFFLMPNGNVIANEIAPRPHNSGHLTIEAFVTSQFEQQLRGICGLPLGSSEQRSPVAMVNLLGELWKDEPPLLSPLNPLFSSPDAHLHLYGKPEARPGRKMGHLTVLDTTVENARTRALELRAQLAK
jgi:5-(carboxyamino)imidazole ribonucleotide synthase